jgi:hypothetical protein
MTTCEHTHAEHLATRRLTHATWVLALLTAVLAVATIALAVVTAKEKEGHQPAEGVVATTQHR